MRLITVLFFVIIASVPGVVNAKCSKTIDVVSENYPPFFDKSLKNQGWMAEVVKTAFERRGCKSTLNLLVWKRVLEKSRKGDHDALLGAFWSKDRTKDFVFSSVIGSLKTGVFALKSREFKDYNGTVASLKGKKLGVGRGYSVSEEFDNAKGLDKRVQKDSKTGFVALSSGGIDMVTGSYPVDLHNLRRLISDGKVKISDNDIRFLEPPLKENGLYLAFSKKAPDFDKHIQEFNNGLLEIMIDGTYAKIKASHGF